jgi:hypothetical protein
LLDSIDSPRLAAAIDEKARRIGPDGLFPRFGGLVFFPDPTFIRLD